MSETRPLVLDVDGTLLQTDMLMESFWSALGRAPLKLPGAVFPNLGNRAALKAALAEIGPIRTDLLPENPGVGQIARAARAEGREVALASASHRPLVEALAASHGLEGARIFASDGRRNLSGRTKAAALVEAYGERGFDYAGNARVDMPVWEVADRAIIVGRVPGAAARLRAGGHEVVEMPGGGSLRGVLRAMRPHQWVKNLLLLLPVIAAHRFDAAAFIPVLWAMAAFSLGASSIYIVNDLLDLEADRLHPVKRGRPFAAGTVPITVGMGAAVLLGLGALAIGASVGSATLGIVALYMATSLAYSLKLKRMRWVDIATLASLYTLRAVAGGVASGVAASGWMVAFIFPIFLTLACVKRLTELTLAASDERLPGRGYARSDRSDLLNVGGLGTFAAMLVFFLYSFSEPARALYPTQWLLWVAMVPIGMWLLRMMLLGYAGKQDYDPIVFAMRDRYGISLILVTLTIMFYAAGLWQRWFGF